MRKQNLLMTAFLAIGIMACVPPQETDQLEKIDPAIREGECNRFISFAYTNYQNQDWEGVVRNYNKAIDKGCGEGHAEEIYPWMARAYINLTKIDSAAYVLGKGIYYLPENIDLLETAAWVAGKSGNLEDQVYYLDKIISIDDKNFKAYESLSNVYRDNNMLDEQMDILEKWLEMEPDNTTVPKELIDVYRKLGKSVLELDRKQWESDRTNVSRGLSYAKGLISEDSYDIAIQVLKELLYSSPNETEVMKLLAESYLSNGQYVNARKTYKDLYHLDKSEIGVPIALTEIYIDISDYATANEWAERAINNSGGSGASYFARAEVYSNCADECQADEITFMDKVVFELAYEDYKEAYARGYKQAKTRRDFLKENLITTKSDWFMRSADEKTVTPTGECYSWIKRSISRK